MNPPLPEDADRSLRQTVFHLSQRWAEADRRVLRQVFPLLARGGPVSVAELSDRAGASSQVVEAALEKGRATRDENGRVTELFGVMLHPTLHRVEVEGVCLFTCCALVAQMVPALVGGDASVESVDPVTRGLVRIEAGLSGPPVWYPADAAASFPRTTPEGIMANVGEAFCSHVRHFTGRESALRFVAAHPARYLLDVPALQYAADQLVEKIWS